MSQIINNQISELRACLAVAGNALARAASIYVAGIDGPEGGSQFRDECRREFPGVTAAFFRDLELVGRGAIDQRILDMGLSCGSKLKRVPLSQQRELIEKGVEVWTGNDSRIIPLAECGPRVIDQCIAVDHVRSPSEQAAWHEEVNAQRRADVAAFREVTTSGGVKVGYRIDRAKKRVKILYPPCFLTAKELLVMLEQIS